MAVLEEQRLLRKSGTLLGNLSLLFDGGTASKSIPHPSNRRSELEPRLVAGVPKGCIDSDTPSYT